jgi:NAD(P)-dependent dehydrogenase (short-subunit alcohol dehydrogenase family)
MRGLKNKVAIVTGALGDIGYASAARLVEEGCRIAIFDNKDDEKGLAAKIDCPFHRVDISDETQVREAAARVLSQLGPASILVNCAAVFVLKSVDATPQDWQRSLSVNVMGTSLVTKHVVPHMETLGGGSIINFSSVSGFIGQGNVATYNATKFAVRGLAKCWALDLAPKNIRVNSICPGYVMTSSYEKGCKELGIDFEQSKRDALAIQLLQKIPAPDQIAAGVAFLASDDAAVMTGSDLVMDAGYLAK